MVNLLYWLQNEYIHVIPGLKDFYTNFYIMRDRLPFFALLLYLTEDKIKFNNQISKLLLGFSTGAGILSIFYLILGLPVNFLTPINWKYAPFEYASQIIIIYLITMKAGLNLNYGIALGYTAAAATGYLYEIPFWIYSNIPTAIIFRNNPQFIFFISYQLIAVFVFIWLLRIKKAPFKIWDLAFFFIAFLLNVHMASQMHVVGAWWNMPLVVRLPMIFYSLYLVNKLRSLNNVP